MSEFCPYFVREKKDGKCSHPRNRGVTFPELTIYPCSLVYCPQMRDGVTTEKEKQEVDG
jgi:hypothetical protein